MRWSAVIGSIALALGSSCSALADGMPRGPAYQQPLSWSGFYVGLNGGYSWGGADTDLSVATSARVRRFTLGGTLLSDTTTAGPSFFTSGSSDVDGWLGGIHTGYNVQSGQWVFGIETDIQRTNEEG